MVPSERLTSGQLNCPHHAPWASFVTSVTCFTSTWLTVDRNRYRSEQVIKAERAWFPPPRSPFRSGMVILTRRSRPRPRRSRPRPGRSRLRPARSAPPRPSEPRCAARGGSGREHAADQRPPGQRADDPVDGDSERLLEAAHRGRGLGPEDPVDREAAARAAGLVAEPELLLESAYRVAGAATGQHDDQGAPGLRPDDPVDVQLVRDLELLHRRLGLRPEDPVHGHVVAAVPQQVLEGRDGMPLAALLYHWPRLDLVAHRVLLWVGPRSRHGRANRLQAR